MPKIEILKNTINGSDLNSLKETFKKNHLAYFDLSAEENRIYFTQDSLSLKHSEAQELLNEIWIINNVILKKVVYYLLSQDSKSLYKLGFTDKMTEVVLHDFARQNAVSPEQLILSYLWRYDVLVDSNGSFKIVEINSMTPTGLPEGLNTYVVENLLNKAGYMDLNQRFDYNMYQSLQHRFQDIVKNSDTKKTMLVVFANTYEWVENIWQEDYVNALYLTEFFKRQLNDYGITVKLGNITDLETKEDGIYFENIKQDYLWSLYPIEWLFIDEWSKAFWDVYIKWYFEIVNNNINLVTQSKAFWAYLFEVIDNPQVNLSQQEKGLIHKYIPPYFFYKPEWVDTLSKPLFYREWVGVGEDDFIGLKVYQQKIEQSSFELNTFEWTKKWYLTIGLYYGQNWFIWNYTRFCESKVTDWTAYFTPVFIKES